MPRYRKEKVGSVVRDIISAALSRRIQDPRVAPLTTITRVEVSRDLLVAKVYLSVQGDEATERRTLAAIRHAGGYLQRMVAGQLTMRHCPELRFEIDKTAKHVRRTLELLRENRAEQPELYEADGRLDPDRMDEPRVGNATDTAPSTGPEAGEK